MHQLLEMVLVGITMELTEDLQRAVCHTLDKIIVHIDFRSLTAIWLLI